jgi:NAD-dependent deacetylase
MRNEYLDHEVFRDKKIVALTGAGVSTLSGIPDFRSGNFDIWKRYTPEKVFDIERFHRDPGYFYSFVNECFPKGTRSYVPNAVHKTLARLEKSGILQTVITQNIDGLHQKAGSQNVLELHGSWSRFFCVKCKKDFTDEAIPGLPMRNKVPLCDICKGLVRPDVVFYGEMLPQETLRYAIACALSADYLFILGSSLVVYPAASIPAHTIESGGKLIIFNNQPTQYDQQAEAIFSDLNDFVMMFDRNDDL